MVVGENPVSDSDTAAEYVRDKDYYFEDGSMVVLAETRLFKIHRTLFERDSPFFQSLLSLPQSGHQQSPEGQSDENPVVCPDSAEDFRALCWVVYSRPADVLAQQNVSTVDVPKLICVVAIAHKYDFTAFGEWAWNILHDSYTAQPLDFFQKCGTWSAFSRLFKLAAECRKATWVDQLEKTCIDQISTSDTRVTAFKEGLNFGEESNLFREFHAKCYYVYLQSSGAFVAQAHNDSILPIDLDQAGSHVGNSLPDVGSERQMRLLAGFWSLSQLRVRLLQPPKLAENPSCKKHATECIPEWNSWWKDVTSNMVRTGDPGILIEHILEKAKSGVGSIRRSHSGFSALDTFGPIHCQAIVISSLAAMKRDFYTSLASRFVLP